MGVRYGSLEKCISVSTPISDWNRVIGRLNRLRYKYRTLSMQLSSGASAVISVRDVGIRGKIEIILVDSYTIYVGVLEPETSRKCNETFRTVCDVLLEHFDIERRPVKY